MKDIKHIFFDLDHTLWDYDKSAKETLMDLYDEFALSTAATPRKFIDTFHQVNSDLWDKYNKGQVDKAYIQKNRFEKIFSKLGVDSTLTHEASTYFIAHCSTKPYLMPDALVALNYLQGKYQLHIITNGFLDAQGQKMSSAGILKYFDVVVSSECADSRKPDPEIFEYSLQKAEATIENSVMIGDNASTDIQGASNLGIRTIFYDPSGQKRSLADFSISSHMELLKLF